MVIQFDDAQNTHELRPGVNVHPSVHRLELLHWQSALSKLRWGNVTHLLTQLVY